jgi:hypothetical protein
MRSFHDHLPRLLRPGGAYSFFNGLCPDNLFFHLVAGEVARRELQRCVLHLLRPLCLRARTHTHLAPWPP